MREDNVHVVIPAVLVPDPAQQDAAAGDARGRLSPAWGAEEGEVREQMLEQDTALRKKIQVIQETAGNRSE